jgi:hypothetical protein
MIKDYFALIQTYNLIDNKPNNTNDGYYEKIKETLQNRYDINLSDINLSFAPLYPDGSLGEIDWIYNLFNIDDFNDFKPKKITVISDNELPPIKVGNIIIIEFITIPNDIFTEALKEVIKSEKRNS